MHGSRNSHSWYRQTQLRVLRSPCPRLFGAVVRLRRGKLRCHPTACNLLEGDESAVVGGVECYCDTIPFLLKGEGGAGLCFLETRCVAIRGNQSHLGKWPWGPFGTWRNKDRGRWRCLTASLPLRAQILLLPNIFFMRSGQTIRTNLIHIFSYIFMEKLIMHRSMQ